VIMSALRLARSRCSLGYAVFLFQVSRAPNVVTLEVAPLTTKSRVTHTYPLDLLQIHRNRHEPDPLQIRYMQQQIYVDPATNRIFRVPKRAHHHLH
jgi:hypothetical protein